MDFTVAIPTFNGESRLSEVLRRLQFQRNLDHLSWEVIVIDNNSTDGTARIVQGFQADFPCPLRYLIEPRQGAAFARKRAIQEAKAELIGFLDDDNWPAPVWVAEAHAFAQCHPQAGAFGSQIHPAFEVNPPAGFDRLLCFLAITERGDAPLRYEPYLKLLPPSAGLVVRKQAWFHSVPEQTVLSGRIEGNMLTGEDLEALAYLQKAGWEIWYNPRMEISHQIPSWRLERDYLIPMFRGIGLSRYVTRMVSLEPWQRPWMTLFYALNDLRKIGLHWWKYGKQIDTDLIAACEWELFRSSLSSPLYLYQHGYLREQPSFPFNAPLLFAWLQSRQNKTADSV